MKIPKWLAKLLADKPLNRTLRGLAWLAIDWFISRKIKDNGDVPK